MANLSVSFALALRHFSLEVDLELGGVVALVGPSGAGKTSVLSVIAGLARPQRGRVALDSEVWLDTERRIDLAPDRRRVGLVFQEYALFPHMTVRQNVAYGGRERVDELLERFRIAQLAAARVTELSGGERQRVALARALARDPGVLLLDEPLAALDANTRAAVRDELATLLPSLGLPTLLVTHDYEDAIAVTDRVGVIVEGRLRQVGSVDELITHPRDAFVASFTGACLLRGRASPRADGAEVELETGELIRSRDRAEGEVEVAIHPWDVAITTALDAPPRFNEIEGEITSLTRVGGRLRVGIGQLSAELGTAEAAALELALGRRARATFDASAVKLIGRIRA